MCDRALSVFTNGELDRTGARDRRVDRLPLAELAFADGEILLVDLFLLKLTCDTHVEVRAFREKDHAARAAVEPLHQVRPRRMRLHFGVKVRLVRLMHALLHDDSRRLVDEDEGVILEEDLQSHSRIAAQCANSYWLERHANFSRLMSRVTFNASSPARTGRNFCASVTCTHTPPHNSFACF